METKPNPTPPAELRRILASYQRPDARRAGWQLANTIIPFIALWAVMAWSVQVSYWLTLALAPLAAGFMIRAFIIFHDCGHGSFYKSQRANDITGSLLGVLTFTPYYHWRHDHAIHHATAGDLDRRGVGDVMVLTVDEYKALPGWKKAGYRVFRHPLFLFTISSFIVFTVLHRFYRPGTGKREKWSVIYTDLALAGLLTALAWLVGWQTVLLVQIPILAIASSVGVWLFYMQHNFPGTFWERHENWDFFKAGLQGSSYYKLPAVLQWFSGNIGFHHIHHLNARIPNYELPRCLRENQVLQIQPLTLRSSLRCLRLRLWDEQNRRMVGFEALKTSS